MTRSDVERDLVRTARVDADDHPDKELIDRIVARAVELLEAAPNGSRKTTAEDLKLLRRLARGAFH
jgi:hypothetical protein